MSEITVLHTDEPMSVEQAIRRAAQVFDKHALTYGHGTSDAISEASWLIQHALEQSPQDVPEYSRSLTVQELQRCNAILQRRINERIPAAYLTGSAWFSGLQFRSDERALVPRSPLAEFIVNDFFGLIEADNVSRILDLCTGGGCIAIACATYVEHAAVIASDLSDDALALAKLNVADHQLTNRLSLVKSSLFENITGKYDLIISNPPYVDAQDIADMGDEFRHEPLMGLAAGTDGLDLVRYILADAAEYLNDNGLLVVEVGNSAEALDNTYPEIEFIWFEFSSGGSGVFAITKEDLVQHAETIKQKLPG